jgi:hypothetical protein
MAKKRAKSVLLTPGQVGHLITGTFKNLIDFKVSAEADGLRFLIILDCVFPEGCIPVEQEPETEDEALDIMNCHIVTELEGFFEAIMRVKWEDGNHYRGFATIPINLENLPEFAMALSDIDEFWIEMDQDIENEEDLKRKTKGKNVVEGNGTIN